MSATEPQSSTEAAAPLHLPLGPGHRIDHWRLSPLVETPFDGPSEPMQGGMDARFFEARHRNFIPHEYPCRRAFAALRRDVAPPPQPEPDGSWTWWFPGQADRVDRSGFWFRPTEVSFQARTNLRLGRGGTVRFRLETCGAARLLAGGRELGWLAPCLRNLGSAVLLEATLEAGLHPLQVELLDLCERDTRLWFRLSLEDAPGLDAGEANIVLEPGVPPDRAQALARRVERLRLDRSSYQEGTPCLLLHAPSSVPLEARIVVGGDFLHGERILLERRIDPGATRIELEPVDRLPAGFRRIEVTLADQGFALDAVLGAETIDAGAQAKVRPRHDARIEETLSHAAALAQGGPAAGLARLALDLPGADPLLQSALPAIERCHDCADFDLVPLLWARMRWGERIAPALRERIDRAIQAFRYWLDEPGDDVMWFFSENHALLFHASAHLAGALYPDARFDRSGRTGAEQARLGAARLEAWLDHFERAGIAEWNAAPYLPIDLKGLLALQALSPDPALAQRSGEAAGHLLERLALASHQGILTASQGRSYEHSLRAARSLEVTGIARLLWGRGWLGAELHCLPLLALAIRDHGFEPPESLTALACWNDLRELEWTMAEGEDGFARLYHYRGQHFAMGSVAAHRVGAWGYQETVLQARIGARPEASIVVNHPGEPLVSGFARPSFWGGNGTIARTHQYRALAALRFDTHLETPGFTHAAFPLDAFDEVRIEPRRAVARSGDGLALLLADQPMAMTTTGPAAGIELRCEGRRTTWLLRLSHLQREGSLDAFAQRFAGLSVADETAGEWRIDDPEYGPIRFAADGLVRAEGRVLDPARWTRAGSGWLSDGTPWTLRDGSPVP